MENGAENRSRGVSFERQPARGHFVEQGAEAEEVGTRIEIVAARLLWRHVCDRADGRAGARQMRRVARDGRRGRGTGNLPRLCRGTADTAHQLRQTKVQYFRLSAWGHEDVGGLDVAVHDAFRVRRTKRIDHLDGQLDKGVEWKRLTPGSFSDQLLERPTLQQLHGNERIALVPANLVDDADIGVVQRGGGTCLTLEPLDSQTISRHFTRKQLDCNGATERRVLGQVHHPHAAFTKLFDNPVMRNGCANHRARQLYTFVRDVPAGSGQEDHRTGLNRRFQASFVTGTWLALAAG